MITSGRMERKMEFGPGEMKKDILWKLKHTERQLS